MRQLRLYAIILVVSGALVGFTLRGAWAAPVRLPAAQTVNGDMISPRSDLVQCLTVNGTDPATAPLLVLDACRGTPQQLWTHSAGSGQWQTRLDPTYCLATVGNTPSAGGSLTVRLCTDSRAVALEPNPTLTDSYRLVGTALVLDWGVYGKVAVASQNGWDYQYFRWFQPDLDVVNAQGCVISYPLSSSDTATYQRELACDHVAKIQPPYVRPVAAQRDPSLFPGAVPTGTLAVTNQSFDFNLQFQDNSYARMAVAPRNWKSTGLYAPAEQLIDVTVSNATATDLSQVYIQIGVHTDVLQPTSSNVANAGQFLRYPNVVTKLKLQPGLNQVRSPYGGLLVLVSNASVNKTITVEIDNAVAAPYFVAGQTTEAEWLARRSAAAPWGEIEGEWAVLSVAASQLRVLSFAEVTALANFFSDVTRYHNAVSGLNPTGALPDRFPQGQQRFVTDKQIALGSAHSGYPTMFFDSYLLGTPFETTLRSSDTDWGMFHEFGHNYQMGAWSYVYGTESTVNIFSLHAQEQFFGNSRLVDEGRYASALTLLNNAAVADKWSAADAFQKLVFLDQLRLGFPALDWTFWQELMRRYRALTSTEYNALNTDPLKYDKFMTFVCDITNTDLTPHFTAWTVPVTQTAKDYCATKPALTRQIWLIDNAKPLWYHPGSGSGSFLREYWTGISGTTLASLTGTAAYPNSPTGSALLTTTLEGPRNFADTYGERLRAYLYPPVTGAYRFWLAGDDSAQLLLSTDADPLHATPLVTLTIASGYRNFDAQVMQVQRSVAVTLTAGQAYYLEVLHKESTGSDSVTVAWNIPATAGLPGEVRKLLDPQYLSPYTGDLVLQQSLAPGQPSAILPGEDVTFQIQVTNQGAAAVHDVQITDSLPAGFTLSPADSNGWVTNYRYVQFQADSEIGATSGTTTVGELGLLDENGAQLTKTGWLATANSQETLSENTPASKAIDNDNNTFWGSKWSGGTTPFPHLLTVDTGAPRVFTGFTYLPRQNSANGRVGNYKFALSVDGSTWVQVASGAFANNATLKSVPFTAPPSGLALGTIAGPLAPGASATLLITLRSALTLTTGAYTNTAQLMAALDGTNTRVREAIISNDAGAATVQIGTQLNTADQVTQQSFSALYHPAVQPCGADLLPSHTITPTLRNNTGNRFSALYFVVTELHYTAATTYTPTLCNADGGQGDGGGARLTVAVPVLGDGVLGAGETFGQAFAVGLPVRARYRLFVNLYGVPTGVVAARPTGGQLLGALGWEFDENGNLVESSGRLFLPLVMQ